MRFDLHLHTTASDGHLTPLQLIDRAAELGLDAMAVTDHDSVEAVAEICALGAARGITVVPGVELSASHDGRDIHILGYFVEPSDSVLLARLRLLREARMERARAMVDALAAEGYMVPLDEVLDLADGGAVGRSHLARALVARGHAQDVADAFQRLIGRGRPFYVPKPVSSPLEVLQTVRDAGGVAVLAHPGVTRVDELIPGLIASGLRGLEAYHGEHSASDRLRYASMAEESGLLVTGGSDYHGPSSPGVDMGAVEMPDEVLVRLLEAGRACGRIP